MKVDKRISDIKICKTVSTKSTNTSSKLYHMEHVADHSVEECKVKDISNCETPEDDSKVDDLSTCETPEDFKDIELEDKEEGFIGPRLPRLMTDAEKEVFFKKIYSEFKLDLRD